MRGMDGFSISGALVAAVAAAGCASLAPAPAWAQGEAQGAAPESYRALGVVAGVKRRAYKGIDNETSVLPFVLYENRWISVMGPGVDLKLSPVGPLSLRLRARYAFDGYEAGDSPSLAGMAERKSSLWAGGAVLWQAGETEVSAELLADASGHSKGRLAKLQVERRWQWDAWEFVPRVAITRHDRKWVDYYYGVRPQEARAGRPAFVGRAAAQAEAGLRVAYHLAPGQMVFGDVSTARAGSAVRDSPVAGRSGEAALAVGYLYRF